MFNLHKKKETDGCSPDFWDAVIKELSDEDGTTSFRWLLDYAKFRRSWLDDAVRSVEDRAVGLIKAVVAVAAGAWVVYVWCLSHGVTVGILTVILLIVALVCAAVAVAFSAAVLIPQLKTCPTTERNAFTCIFDNPMNADPCARFTAYLASSTEEQELQADTKGRRLRKAYWAITVAVVFFLVSLGASLRSHPAETHQPSTQAQVVLIP